MQKPDVREVAKRHRLAVARREESTELCFAGEGDYRKVFGNECVKPGVILDLQENVIGRHDGVHEFTVRQRSGIGIASHATLYVVKMDAANNTL